jgi:tRNA 2-selenouridine synthase SelU
VAADHRGSVLGQEPATNFIQPTQKMFESRLLRQMEGFDPKLPVFIEGESSRVGVRNVPRPMWERMKVSDFHAHCGWVGEKGVGINALTTRAVECDAR